MSSVAAASRDGQGAARKDQQRGGARIYLVSEEPKKRQSSEKPAMDAPQEEFISPEAVPSKPEKFAGEKAKQSEQKRGDQPQR